MESLVLKTLQFDVSVPTCKDFLNRYLLAAGAAEESQLRYLSQVRISFHDCHHFILSTPALCFWKCAYDVYLKFKWEIWGIKLIFVLVD